MTKSLPPTPSVKFLKLEAKNVLKAHRNGDTSCLEVLRHLHQFKDKPESESHEPRDGAHHEGPLLHHSDGGKGQGCGPLEEYAPAQ